MSFRTPSGRWSAKGSSPNWPDEKFSQARTFQDSAGGVDGGYPSSIQLEDGSILTAYYCSRLPWHQRYHMGVVFWQD